jgi:hypothetical protein
MPYEVGPFDSRHYYCQWGGTLPGNDEWSCGIRLAPNDPQSAVNDPALLAKVATAIQKFHTTAGAGISGRAILTFVKCNLIEADGHYSEGVTYEQVMANVPGGGGSTNSPPNQIALAISLTTAVSRGPAHRGRFFAPMPIYLLANDGRISTADQALAKTTATTLLTELNAASANTKVAVYSRKRLAPAHRIVTGIAVGRVYDTQRRRRNKLVEAYV